MARARPGLVREVVFPTPKSGAVPAYETYVDSASESYRQVQVPSSSCLAL